MLSKDLLVSSQVLTHYDPSLPLILVTRSDRCLQTRENNSVRIFIVSED